MPYLASTQTFKGTRRGSFSGDALIFGIYLLGTVLCFKICWSEKRWQWPLIETYRSRARLLGQLRAYGFVPPGTWTCINPQSWQWAYLRDEERIAEAKRLYEEAGHTPAKPISGIRSLSNAKIAIKQTAIPIAAMWKETLGIETELTEEELSSLSTVAA